MRRALRLRKTADFAAARRRGKSGADHRLVVIACPNRSSAPRFGFSVSKRIGNAVNRNKIKRRLKAAAVEAGVEGGWDLIVIARQGARSAGYWELRRSLRRLLGRAKVIGRKDQAGANVGRGAR